MAVRRHIEEWKGHRLLSVNSPLVWCQLREFNVLWRDNGTSDLRYLGDMSPGNENSKATCYFVVGYHEGSRESLAYFYLPLKMSNASRRAKHIYLVIPAESFDGTMTDSDPCVDAPAGSFDFQATRELDGVGGFSHLRFALKQPGHVLMPEANAEALSNRARGLLLSLESLSRASSFDLYFPRTQQGESWRRNFFRCLDEGPVQSPEIDHRDTFSGHPYLTNGWKAYGLREGDTLPSRWNPMVEDSPPSYDEAVSSPPKDRGEYGEGQAGSQKDGDGHGRPEESSDDRSATEEDNYRKRKACEALSDAETDDGRNRARERKRSDQEEAIHDKSRDTPNGAIYDDTSSVVTWTQNKFESVALDVLARDNLFFPRPHCLFFPHSPERDQFDDTQFSWFVDAVLWLRTALHGQDNAPDVYFKELGILCQAIRTRDRPTFEKTRLQCMVDFVRQERKNLARGPLTFSVEDRIKWVIEFVYKRLGPGSDTLIANDLMGLHGIAIDWMNVGGDDGPNSHEFRDEHTRLELSFITQMAVCVLLAIYKDGRERYAQDDTSVIHA